MHVRPIKTSSDIFFELDPAGAAVAQVRDGCLLAEIAGAIEDTLSSHGYAANPKLGGHGIGREHHEPGILLEGHEAVGVTRR